MRRLPRWAWPVLVVLLVALAFALWPEPATRSVVTLADGRQIRVLEATLGTNHLHANEARWKARLRRSLPASWARRWPGPLKGTSLWTRHETLVLWIEQTHPDRGLLAPPREQLIEAVLPDGTRARGVWRDSPGGTQGSLTFTTFARPASRLPFTVADGANSLPLWVDNPRPARLAAWQPRPCPQTSALPHLEIVLKSLTPVAPPGASRGAPHLAAQLQARVSGEGSPGWITWRATMTDTAGNWVESDPAAFGSKLRLPSLPAAYAPWKIQTEAVEIISAGKVAWPVPGAVEPGLLNPRAIALGINRAIVVGAGAYRIVNGLATREEDATSAPTTGPTLLIEPGGDGTNFALRLNTSLPGVLWIANRNAPAVKARLRERLADGRGRIFQAHANVLVTNHAPGVIAGFFSSRLMDDARNLEAELLIQHPPAVFVAGPPSD